LSASWQGYVAPANAPFLLAGEGANTVSGCVRDAARNVSSITGVAMNLDTTPPAALSLLLNGGASYFNASQVVGGRATLSAVGQATGATEWALSEGTPSSFGGFTSGTPQSFVVSGDGVHTVHAVFRDALWNLSSPISATITVDTAAPSVTGTSLAL